jgi:hypothetical protein
MKKFDSRTFDDERVQIRTDRDVTLSVVLPDGFHAKCTLHPSEVMLIDNNNDLMDIVVTEEK